ncbi:hypothetical protein BDQ17DRAFT_1421227 [Cyathus striatus]|nr:hypothetical protein BDQ17DRAFT_1421227 [Cyathus striatus]
MEWLDRSRGCPLSISVYQTSDFGPVYPNDEDLLEEECQLHLSFVINTLLPYSKNGKTSIFVFAPNFKSHFEELAYGSTYTIAKEISYYISRGAQIITHFARNVSIMGEHCWQPHSVFTTHTFTILGSLLLKSDLSLIPHSVWTQVTELTWIHRVLPEEI